MFGREEESGRYLLDDKMWDDRVDVGHSNVNEFLPLPPQLFSCPTFTTNAYTRDNFVTDLVDSTNLSKGYKRVIEIP